MTDTPELSLPLLQPAQAQKHVTVNEALVRLDGLAQLRLASVSTGTPPGGVAEGSVYAVPPGAVNAWAGEDGNLAIAANGGWVFVAPRRGWRALVLDQGVPAVFDGAEAITGTATAWDLGVAGDTGRFGTGLGTALNSWVNGPSAPTVYWSPTPLEITAVGGSFAAGAVRLAVHYAELHLPDPV